LDLIRRAIVLRPNYVEAYSNLSNVLRDLGQLDEAVTAARQAISLRPDYAQAHNNLANALKGKGQLDEAIASYLHAITFTPSYVEAHCNLSGALIDGGQLNEAIGAARQAISLDPNYAQAHSNLGNALKDAGQLDAAIAAYRRAVHLKPDFAQGHFNLGVALLMRGDFNEGWRQYEWRGKERRARSLMVRFPQPLWDGGDLSGRTIFLHMEQGFGDMIQFIRYLPLVAGRSGRVFVESPRELIRLFGELPGVAGWILRGQPLPAFDVQCPLLSLPRVFATTLQTIPSQKNLLRRDPNLAQAWGRRPELQQPGLKVGLVWAGQSKPVDRSVNPADLAPLAELDNIRFFSLQKLKAPLPPLELIDWTDELEDFADTAALIANLDLILTIDTSVAHLAATLGKPTWVLLNFAPDWRWMMDRSDSPWYPTMRLFRQPRHGDWKNPIAQVKEALHALT
jgi:Tfp pilus assembly protein PilF